MDNWWRPSAIVGWKMPPKWCLRLNPWNLWILSYMAKKSICRHDEINDLEMGYHHGVSGWALNAITSVLIRVWQKEIWQDRRKEGHVKKEAEIRVVQPQTKECRQSPEAGRNNKLILRQSLWRECSICSQFSDSSFELQASRNCERINFCCFKPTEFVTVAIGS